MHPCRRAVPWCLRPAATLGPSGADHTAPNASTRMHSVISDKKSPIIPSVLLLLRFIPCLRSEYEGVSHLLPTIRLHGSHEQSNV